MPRGLDYKKGIGVGVAFSTGSSSSSSDSSSEAEAARKDANAIISKSSFKAYGLDLFPDPKLLLHIVAKNKHIIGSD